MSNENKIYLHEYFKNKKLGFFNCNFLVDSGFFIDPMLVFNSNIIEFKNSRELVINFFLKVVEMDERNIKTIINMLKIKEPKENKLGTSKTRNNGRGIGNKKAKDIYQNILNIKNNIEDFNGHFEAFVIFGKDIGLDNISDFIFSILKPSFVEYTQRMLKENDNFFDLSDNQIIDNCGYSFESNNWQKTVFSGLPNLPNDDRILFVPKDFLGTGMYINKQTYNSYLYSLDDETIKRTFNYDIFKGLREKMDELSSINRIRKSNNKKPIKLNYEKMRKDLIVQHCSGKINGIKSFINGLDIKNVSKYDFQADEQRQEIISKVFRDSSGELDQILQNLSEELRTTKEINQMCLNSEKEFQKILIFGFNMVNKSKIGSKKILLEEVTINNGRCDIVYIDGKTNVIPIEIKFLSNKRWKHGIKQAEKYRERLKVEKGILLLIAIKEDEKREAKSWKDDFNTKNKDSKIDIKIVDLVYSAVPSKL